MTVSPRPRRGRHVGHSQSHVKTGTFENRKSMQHESTERKMKSGTRELSQLKFGEAVGLSVSRPQRLRTRARFRR